MYSDLKYWYLHDHKLFRNLNFNDINALCILKRFKKSTKNELLDLGANDQEKIFFLKQGVIKLIRVNNEGDEVLIDILQKGDLFGTLGFENKNADQDFFKVISDEAVLCMFYKERMEEVMISKPEFALSYIKFIGFNFKKIENSYKNILFRDAKSRLLLLINSIIEKEKVVEKSFVLPNYLTQKDIAQLICTTRQTVVSLFKELEDDGVLLYSQKVIQIPDLIFFRKVIQNVK